MNIQTEKLDIIQWLATVNDSNIIQQIKLLKQSSEETANLTEAQIRGIDDGLRSIKAGRVKSHEEVVKATEEKYKHLHT